MAVQRTGTTFTLKGVNKFISGLKRVNKEFSQMSATASKMSDSVAKAGSRITKAQQKQSTSTKKLSIAEKQLVLAEEAITKAVAKGTATLEQQIRIQIRYERAILGVENAQNNLAHATQESIDALSDQDDATKEATSNSISAGEAVGLLAAGFGAVVISLTLAVAALRSFINALKKIGKAILKSAVAPLKLLVNFIKSTFAAIRNNDAIRNLVDQLGVLKDAAIAVISEFQTLEIRIQNLVARELRLSGAVSDVADSFTAAIPHAKELTKWITDLSLKVPFDVKDIANTTAFALAMGFTTIESKSLTESIGNFAAGMGLASDKMESMIFNFGQMKAAGKVTGTEMRDLARGSFFPLTDVLDEAAKMLGRADESMTEFRKSAAAGEVPIDAFFKAFEIVVARDFPQAMERMARTLQGVATRFKNFFKTVIGVDLLGPVMKRFAETASNALDKLLTPGVEKAARAIGESLVWAFDRLKETTQPIIEALKKLAQAFGFTGVSVIDIVRAVAYATGFLQKIGEVLAEFINKVAEGVNSQFGSLTENMYAWGLGMISALAEGIAAAAKWVIQALTFIGKIIASLLETHSPPKLLPHLGKWGGEAMTEYMKGWLTADFSVFDEIADKIESFIRSFTEDFIKAEDVVPAILRVRDNLARAFNEIARTGRVSADILSNIFSGLANATPEVREYTRLLLEVAKANKAVSNAQKELNDITDRYDAILKPMLDRLEEINDATLDFDGARRATQLRLILGDVNASEGDKQRARLELERIEIEKNIRAVEEEKEEAVDAAGEKVSAAEKARDALVEQLEIQEGLVDTQIKTNELIKEQVSLLESLKQALSGVGGVDLSNLEELGFGDLDFGFGEDPFFDEDFAINFPAIFENAKARIDEIFKDLTKIFDDAFGGMGEDAKELETVWGRIFGDDGALSSFLDSETLSKLGTLVTEFGDLVIAVGNLAVATGDLALAFVNLIFPDTEGLSLLSINIGFFSTSFSGLAAFIDTLTLAFSLLAQALTILSEIDAMAITDLFSRLGVSLGLVDESAVHTGNIWDVLWNQMTGKTDDSSKEIGTTVDAFSKDTTDEMQKMSDKLVGKSIIPDMLSEMETAFSTSLAAILGTEGGDSGVRGWVSDIISAITDKVDLAYNAGADFVQGLFDGMVLIWNVLEAWAIDRFAWLSDLLNSVGELNSMPKTYGGGVAPAPAVPENIPMSSTTNNNYNLTMPTTASPSGVQRAFNVMAVMSA